MVVIRFQDGLYQLRGFGENFSFDTECRYFKCCLENFVTLAWPAAKRMAKQGSRGEGSYEMDFYIWLYSCFAAGCSQYLERAWYEILTYS